MRPVRIGRRILVAVAIAALAVTIGWHLRPAGRQRGVELPPVAARALHPADIADAPEVVARLLARGAELVGEVVQYEDSYRLVYVRGPEGIIIALAAQLG